MVDHDITSLTFKVSGLTVFYEKTSYNLFKEIINCFFFVSLRDQHKLRVRFDLKISTGPLVPTVVPLDLKNIPSLLFSACFTNLFF